LTDYDYGTVSTLANGQTLREYTLVASDKTIEVAPGIDYPAWVYNGRIPGSTLRCTKGDRIRVHFTNLSSHPHTIHFHGIHPVVGFIIQNITEGLGVIAPVLRDRPGFKHLLLMGLIAGAPAILGAWIGGLSPSPTLVVLFLGIGTGAIFEVTYEIARLIGRDTAQESMPLLVFSGVTAGMLALWVTGLLIKSLCSSTTESGPIIA
jgi:hypothetical protein